MAYVALAKLKKNSVSTTLSSGIAADTTTIPVSDLSVFHDEDGTLITRAIVIGFQNLNETYPEEITITGASATSGAGNLTGASRGVNADGSIGAGRIWDSGTEIAVMFSTGIYNIIKDNFAAHQTILATMPNRNAIINGDCRVNQRGTAYTLVKDAYTWDSDDLTGPDRHEGMATGTAVSSGTWEQATSATAGSSGYAFKFAGVTLTGTGVLYHRYRMEAKDAVRFKNQAASFSCSVYQDTGGAINYTVYVRKANAADNFSAVTAISNSGAISVPSATKTALKYENISMSDCSNGIEIEIKIECGAITTKNFEQTELQFEIGSVVTTFEVRPYVDELQRCLRYAVLIGKTGSNSIVHPFSVLGASPYFYIGIILPVIMRVAPTLSTSSPTFVNANPSGNEFCFYDEVSLAYLVGVGSIEFTTPTPSTNYLTISVMFATSLNGTSGDVGFVILGSTAFFLLVAEL